MKIAVIGTGKTGGEVIKLLDDDQIVGPFDTGHPPTLDKLKAADAAIVFVPGSAVDDIKEIVLSAEIAAAWGSTGHDWQDDELDAELKDHGIKWMRASNFSLGMNIVRRCLRIIGQGSGILDDPQFAIHEIHHTGKQDAPSGTALSWEQWLGREATITSERKGDIKGIHRLRMQTASESVELKHEAHNRAVFAKGALWAVHQLMDKSRAPGFYTMETFCDEVFAGK
jgi:4-hydroxy-tetrahydrodipicolinate reductase